LWFRLYLVCISILPSAAPSPPAGNDALAFSTECGIFSVYSSTAIAGGGWMRRSNLKQTIFDSPLKLAVGYPHFLLYHAELGERDPKIAAKFGRQ
jgi:hypothetical protein